MDVYGMSGARVIAVVSNEKMRLEKFTKRVAGYLGFELK